MKTYSILCNIPRDTQFHNQEIDQFSIDLTNVTEQYISNITCSIDTTSLYNIRETNIIYTPNTTTELIKLEPGYYNESNLRTYLSNVFTITDSAVTCIQDADISHAKCLKKILYHTINSNDYNIIHQSDYYDCAADYTAGLSIIKVYSNIVKEVVANTSLIDIPIYVSNGLDNIITRNNLYIPINITANTRTIELHLENVYNEVISLNQPTYINMVLNFEEI